MPERFLLRIVDPFVRTQTVTVGERLTEGCIIGVASASWTPTAPTCADRDGSGLLLRDHAALVAATVNGTTYTNLADFTASVHPNPAPSNSDWVLTFQADSGYAFANGTTLLTVPFHVGAYLSEEECTPDIGGRTIGFWTNKNGAPVAQSLWANAISPYSSAIGNLTYAQGQTALKASNSTNLGKDMLRAPVQRHRVLNVQFIAGYGAQHITVPARRRL